MLATHREMVTREGLMTDIAHMGHWAYDNGVPETTLLKT